MSNSFKLIEGAFYLSVGAVAGYTYRINTGWVRPKGWVGYYPSSEGEAKAHPLRSPECDMYHEFPCPKKECRGYQGPVKSFFTV